MYIPKNRWFTVLFSSYSNAKIVKFTYSKSMNSVREEVIEVTGNVALFAILLNIFHLHQRIFFIKYCNRVFKVHIKFYNISKKTDFCMNYLKINI